MIPLGLIVAHLVAVAPHPDNVSVMASWERLAGRGSPLAQLVRENITRGGWANPPERLTPEQWEYVRELKRIAAQHERVGKKP